MMSSTEKRLCCCCCKYKKEKENILAKVGWEAPGFKKMALVKGKFKEITLEEFKGKWVVLFFYPMDFTFVCPTEIIEFSKRIKEFEALNTVVLGCSTDSEYCHLTWTRISKKKGGIGKIKYPLIADVDKSLSKSYGILGKDKVPLRGLFIIDSKGILKQIMVNGMDVGRNISEVLRLVSAYQFVEKKGGVCGVNWKKGDKGINTKDEKSFFKDLEKMFEEEKKSKEKYENEKESD